MLVIPLVWVANKDFLKKWPLMCKMNQQLLSNFEENQIILSSSKNLKDDCNKKKSWEVEKEEWRIFFLLFCKTCFKWEFLQTPHTRRIYKCKYANLVYFQRMLLTSTVQKNLTRELWSMSHDQVCVFFVFFHTY